eukprot:gene27083-33317_t
MDLVAVDTPYVSNASDLCLTAYEYLANTGFCNGTANDTTIYFNANKLCMKFGWNDDNCSRALNDTVDGCTAEDLGADVYEEVLSSAGTCDQNDVCYDNSFQYSYYCFGGVGGEPDLSELCIEGTECNEWMLTTISSCNATGNSSQAVAETASRGQAEG